MCIQYGNDFFSIENANAQTPNHTRVSFCSILLLLFVFPYMCVCGCIIYTFTHMLYIHTHT